MEFLIGSVIVAGLAWLIYSRSSKKTNSGGRGGGRKKPPSQRDV